jgi:aryl-alcohol dehydrogenase-like predicted oxidoreductase
MLYLNDLISAGKVHYLGISDTPAWVVAQANQYARDHGLRGFVAYQGRYSALHRDMERDLFALMRSDGMANVAFGVLGQGTFKGEDEPTVRMARPSSWEAGEIKGKVREALAGVAQRLSGGERGKVGMGQVAIAYAMAKQPYTFPVLGGRTVEQMKTNVAALEIALSKEDVEAIDAANVIDRGFPLNMMAPAVTSGQIEGPADLWVTPLETTIEHVKA